MGEGWEVDGGVGCEEVSGGRLSWMRWSVGVDGEREKRGRGWRAKKS